MLVTIPFMCRVVSVQRLKIATVSGAIRVMSCSTVLDVCAAMLAERCACMSCAVYEAGARGAGRMESHRESVHAPLLEHAEPDVPAMGFLEWLVWLFLVKDKREKAG
jgi:hypothetical protein